MRCHIQHISVEYIFNLNNPCVCCIIIIPVSCTKVRYRSVRSGSKNFSQYSVRYFITAPLSSFKVFTCLIHCNFISLLKSFVQCRSMCPKKREICNSATFCK